VWIITITSQRSRSATGGADLLERIVGWLNSATSLETKHLVLTARSKPAHVARHENLLDDGDMPRTFKTPRDRRKRIVPQQSNFL